MSQPLHLLEKGITQQRPQCERTRGYIRLVCPHGNVKWVPATCKSWECEACARLKRLKLLGRISWALSGQSSAVFLTLTFAHDTEAAAGLSRLASMLRRLRADTGQPLEYVAVKEPTERGRLHLHLLLLGWAYVPWAKLSALWNERTGAWHVWVKKVWGGQGAARYLVKYLTKLSSGSVWRKRISFSRGFPKPSSVWAQMFGAEWFATLTAAIVAHGQEALQGSIVVRGSPCLCFGPILTGVVQGSIYDDHEALVEHPPGAGAAITAVTA